jgi:hypothetical protein
MSKCCSSSFRKRHTTLTLTTVTFGRYDQRHDLAPVRLMRLRPAMGCARAAVPAPKHQGVGRWSRYRALPPWRSWAIGPRVTSEGRVLWRRGRVHIDADADDMIWVSGATTTRVSGPIDLQRDRVSDLRHPVARRVPD